MAAQNNGNLNRLLTELGDTHPVSSRWLRAHGYSNSLIAHYVSHGWLTSPARGVYLRQGGHLQWEGVIHSLQIREGLALHVGGRFALSLHGHEHYLRLGDAGTVTLYGAKPPPGWVGKLPIKERFVFSGNGSFKSFATALTADTPDATLAEQGLMWYRTGTGHNALVCSTPERAMLELCAGVSDAALVYEADALMQAMTTLRPQRVSLLLRQCGSIKAKRLFLALAERHQHAWLPYISLDDVNLGQGKRVLVPDGTLHPTWHITLPRDLDEHLV